MILFEAVGYLAAATLGFAFAVLLLALVPSVALFFAPLSSSSTRTSRSSTSPILPKKKNAKGTSRQQTDKEEEHGKAKEAGGDLPTQSHRQPQLPSTDYVAAKDGSPATGQADPPAIVVTAPSPRLQHDDDRSKDASPSLSSSPSFPHLAHVSPSPSSTSSSSTSAASLSSTQSCVAASLPSPAPSVYSFFSSSTGAATSSNASLGLFVSCAALPSSSSSSSSSDSSSSPSSPETEDSPASPSLASSLSYPPHSSSPSSTSSPSPASGSSPSNSSVPSAPAKSASAAAARMAPPARLVKRQTNFLESVKLGQARETEATSSLPNPAVHQWWEMERLLEKEYATIEEKAFGVMMKLMPFRSGEGLKDPPKIVPNPDHGNRVALTPLEGAPPEHDTTFYNASYIKKGQFIAASMPHNDLTRQDFWRMIYEQDCRLIVMLNLEDESHGDAYWPNELNSTTHYGPMAITKTEQMRMRFYESTVRKFRISRTDQPDAQPKQVLHVHNTVWPDKGIPENVEAFTDMVEYVKQEYEQLSENKTGPMTVHCFGGIGRTGSFLTCVICLLSIRENQEANVFNTVLNLRTDRAMMVQTKEQYKFCYRVVMELLARSKRKALHRGLSGVLRRSAKRKPGAAAPVPAAVPSQAGDFARVLRSNSESDASSLAQAPQRP